MVVFLNSLSNYLSLGLHLPYMLVFKKNKCPGCCSCYQPEKWTDKFKGEFNDIFFLENKTAAARLSTQQQDVHFITFVLPLILNTISTRRGPGGRSGGTEPARVRVPARVFLNGPVGAALRSRPIGSQYFSRWSTGQFEFPASLRLDLNESPPRRRMNASPVSL